MKENLKRAVFASAVGSGLTYYRYPKASVNAYGRDMDVWIYTGALLALSTLASETVHDNVFPVISKQDRKSDTMSAVANAVVAGGVFTMVSDWLNPEYVDSIGKLKVFGYVAGLSYVAPIAYDMVQSFIEA